MATTPMFCLLHKLSPEDEARSRPLRLAHYRRHAQFAHLELPERDEQGQLKHEVYTVNQGEGRTELKVVGPIDLYWGFDPGSIMADLDEAAAQHIHMIVSSPGGFVELAMMLYEDLRRRAKQGVRITSEGVGLVGSAGLDLFLAGDERSMGESTIAMTHPMETFDFVAGTKEEVEQQSKSLTDQMEVFIQMNIDLFQARTGQSAEALEQWLRAKGEVWFTAQQAFEAGITTIDPGLSDDGDSSSEEDGDPAMRRQAHQARRQVQQAYQERLSHLMDTALSL